MIWKTRQNMEAKANCLEGLLEVLARSCHKSRTIFKNKTPVFCQIGYNFLVEVMRGLRSVTLELLAIEFKPWRVRFSPLVLQLSTNMGKIKRFNNCFFPTGIWVESLQLFPPNVINIINRGNLSIYFPLDISFILPEIESASALSFSYKTARGNGTERNDNLPSTVSWEDWCQSYEAIYFVLFR